MRFLRDFILNLLLLVLLVGAMGVCLAIFFPKAREILFAMGQVYNIPKLWPLLIVLVLYALPLPRRRK